MKDLAGFVLNREQSRMVDRIAIGDFGMSGLVLMENAGRGCAEQLLQLGIEGEVVVCCGSGNNGGDGLVMARHLRNRGAAVRVLLSSDPKTMAGDARQNYEILAKTDLPMLCCATIDSAEISRLIASTTGSGPAWVVDALLGTGSVGPVRAPLVAWIESINASPARRMAIDLPSGLDCDTGSPIGPCVRADHTCTFVSLKPCFLREPGKSLSGKVSVIDIGVPKEIIAAVERHQRANDAVDFGPC